MSFCKKEYYSCKELSWAFSSLEHLILPAKAGFPLNFSLATGGDFSPVTSRENYVLAKNRRCQANS